MTGAAIILAAALLLPGAADTVSVSETGATYHRRGAAHVARFALVACTRAEADSAGYSACRPCWTPRAAKASRLARLRARRAAQ